MIDNIKNAMPQLFEYLPLHPEQASSVSLPVDILYFVWMALSLFFSLLIAAAAIFMMVHYRRRAPGQVGAPETHAPVVEALSITIPFAIAMAMFVWGAKLYVDLRRPPENAVEYFAFGKQWMWKFQHPNGLRQINHLTVPRDTPIRITMTSEDVIHSFFVPAFRVKQDVVPGRYTTVWFTATETGEYHLFCAEYCGTEHSLMKGTVTVLEREEYEAWLRRESDPATATPASTGEELFTSLACVTCHEESDTTRGPALHGLFGSEIRLASGATIEADESYLRQSILEPMADIRAGYQPLMPTFAGQVSEQQLADLVRYLKTLGAQRASVEHPRPENATPQHGSPDRVEETRSEPTRGRQAPAPAAGASGG
ncbi:MAG TPA: cytochrome c oxidase subunit II [Thermoanaerobaculia bacterium]|nr:cytochrome c oxidase subunit II [Thermoanaerobaculia bacterium]